MAKKAKTTKEKIAERGMEDLDKSIAKMNAGKKRGRKPAIHEPEQNQETSRESVEKMDAMAAFINTANFNRNNIGGKNAIRIIEDEVGKEKLVRLAVKYLYNSIEGGI